MGVVIVILLILGCAAAAYFLLLRNPGEEKAEASPTEIMHNKPPEEEPWKEIGVVADETAFVPQDTVYRYYNPVPGAICPHCDAENPAAMSFCQVCGSRLN